MAASVEICDVPVTITQVGPDWLKVLTEINFLKIKFKNRRSRLIFD